MANKPVRRIRILFIDDDGSIRIFAAVMFKDALFDIRVAADTREADNYLKKGTFDVIVCDVMMPGEDGIQYCNRLKQAGQAIPFIFLSAVGTPDSVNQGLAAGANAYFIKPFDARELQKRIVDMVMPSLGDHKSLSDPNDTKKRTNWWNR